eukprot:2255361-Pleurochrysis_carterae.AAC.1
MTRQRSQEVQQQVWAARRAESDAVAEQLRRIKSELEVARRAVNAARNNRTQRLTELENELQKSKIQLKSLETKVAARNATIKSLKRSQEYAVNQSYSRQDALRAASEQHQRHVQALHAQHAKASHDKADAHAKASLDAADAHTEALRRAAVLQQQLSSELKEVRATLSEKADEVQEMARKISKLETKVRQMEKEKGLCCKAAERKARE